MRPTRVIYVENDPALLGILAKLLMRRDDIDVILATDSVDEVLASTALPHADVALIDLALGTGQLNGIDLGILLRRKYPNLGIVIHSQHSLDQIERRLPESDGMGWSTVQKTGEMRIDDLCDILRTTARGVSVRHANTGDSVDSRLDRLSARQRTVMGMAAIGLSTKEMARRLDSTEAAIRQDLSKAYRILVPEADDSVDLRTRAVLAFMGFENAREGELR